MALVIRSSKIHAAGCYTTTPVSKATHIVEYTGPRLTVEEADTRSNDRPETYLFGLSDGQHVIDGDGVAAFINHCCDPNCEADEIDGRVWIIALRDIAAGDHTFVGRRLSSGARRGGMGVVTPDTGGEMTPAAC